VADLLIRSKGELLGYVDAANAEGAEAAAAEQFRLDGGQRRAAAGVRDGLKSGAGTISRASRARAEAKFAP
jgi:hypothetical protein